MPALRCHLFPDPGTRGPRWGSDTPPKWQGVAEPPPDAPSPRPLTSPAQMPLVVTTAREASPRSRLASVATRMPAWCTRVTVAPMRRRPTVSGGVSALCLEAGSEGGEGTWMSGNAPRNTTPHMRGTRGAAELVVPKFHWTKIARFPLGGPVAPTSPCRKRGSEPKRVQAFFAPSPSIEMTSKE